MDIEEREVGYEFPPYVRVYKDGYVERLQGEDFLPPTADPEIAVSSKDVTIDQKTGLIARLYLSTDLATAENTTQKLPLLVYFHGGAFLVSSPFNSTYHNHVNTIVSQAKVVAVSVHYRRAPDNPIPIAYEDSREALRWVASHKDGKGQEGWLNNHVDFDRVFLAGDSAGANISHRTVLTAGDENSRFNMDIRGLALVQPYFWGSKSIGSEADDQALKNFVDEIWPIVSPSSMPAPGLDDQQINPFGEGAPSLKNLKCKKVIIFVGEKDVLRQRGWLYYKALKNSGWEGEAQIEETEGEGHIFHLLDPTSEKAKKLVKTLVAFLLS